MKLAVCLYKALLLICLVAIPTVQGQVIISEFMASNTRTLLDEDGESSDWIEIFNVGQTNVNLNGWGLSDVATNPRRWRFPSIELPAGKSMIVFASGKNRRVAGSPLHTDFRLSGTGGYMGLADANGTNVFTYPSYPEQAPDISFGVVWQETRATLLSADSPVRFIIPTDEMLATSWTSPEYPVGNWPLVPGPVGFDQNPTIVDDAWLIALTNSAPAILYNFEGSGALIVNSGTLGPSLTGTNVGAMSTAQVSLRPPDAPGMETNNLTVRFDGVNDYVNTGKGALNNLSAFTMSGWIKPAALTKSRVGLWGQHEVIEFGFIEADTLQLSTANGGAIQAEYPCPPTSGISSPRPATAKFSASTSMARSLRKAETKPATSARPAIRSSLAGAAFSTAHRIGLPAISMNLPFIRAPFPRMNFFIFINRQSLPELLTFRLSHQKLRA